jgi:hypothetical protein
MNREMNRAKEFADGRADPRVEPGDGHDKIGKYVREGERLHAPVDWGTRDRPPRRICVYPVLWSTDHQPPFGPERRTAHLCGR